MKEMLQLTCSLAETVGELSCGNVETRCGVGRRKFRVRASQILRRGYQVNSEVAKTRRRGQPRKVKESQNIP